MVMRSLWAGLALTALVFASGCSCCHKRSCAAPVVTGAPPCCPPGAPAPPAPAGVLVPTAPAPGAQFYGGPPPVANGLGH